MSGAISQMQMVYNPEEDRILYRVNTIDKNEFRFWISRRYAMLLLKVLKDHRSSDPDLSTLATPEDKKVVQEFKREQAMDGANFKKKFEEDNNQYPLGEEAKLAFKLTYNVKPDGNLMLSLQPKDGQGINVAINQDINFTLTELILSAGRKGDWKLDEWFAKQVESPEEKRVIN